MSSVANSNGVVYLLTSPSGKQYVGQSWNYETRMTSYRRGGCKGQPAIHAAIRKHGWNNFTATVIKRGIQTQEALDAAETAFIETLGTVSPHGYNLMSGGRGGKLHAETKAKLSAANSNPTSDARAKMSELKRGERNPNFGKRGEKSPRFGMKHTAETKAKMSDAQRGEKHHMFGKSPSQETRNKLSAAMRGKPSPNKGKTASLETRAKMRASAIAAHARKRAASSNSL